MQVADSGEITRFNCAHGDWLHGPSLTTFHSVQVAKHFIYAGVRRPLSPPAGLRWERTAARRFPWWQRYMRLASTPALQTAQRDHRKDVEVGVNAEKLRVGL